MKKELIISILVALLIIGAGVYFYSSRNVSSDQVNNSVVTTNTSPSATGWKTYDSGHGFSFKYPSNFKLDSSKSTPQQIVLAYFDGGQKSLVIKVETSGALLEENVKTTVATEKANASHEEIPPTISYKSQLVGNVSGYLITNQAGDTPMTTDAIFKTRQGNYIVSFSYSYQGATVDQNSSYKTIQAIIASTAK